MLRTTSLTDTVAWLPVVPAAVISTVVEWNPGARDAGFTETDNTAGAVPDADESPTHEALAEATHESVPPPLFVSEMCFGAGMAPPSM